MRNQIFRMSLIPILLWGLLGTGSSVEAVHSNAKPGIPARKAADYVHAVIEAGRYTYSTQIVDRLGTARSFPVSENWQREQAFPLPAQFLKISSEISNNHGIGMRYRLVSLWPINPENAPTSEKVKRGLEEVASRPDTPFTWLVQLKGVWYYETIYPDRAVNESCVRCHNNHPASPRKDFRLGQVMGGLVIDLPLGRSFHKESASQITIPPEVVADYVHSVLEADREVYSHYVVDRLGKVGTLGVSEHWERDNALMLPAQFLVNTSRFIRNKNIGLDFNLISLWPINPKNGPANEFERLALETVEIHPIRPYIGTMKVGRQSYFQAVYPDLAVTESCVECHNTHPKSPKHDYKLNDVMGGIVVTLPLE